MDYIDTTITDLLLTITITTSEVKDYYYDWLSNQRIYPSISRYYPLLNPIKHYKSTIIAMLVYQRTLITTSEEKDYYYPLVI